jgi:hypothetical protein
LKAFSPKSESDSQRVRQDRKRPPSREGVSAEEAGSRPTAFVDNRPGAVAQRRLHSRIDQSPRVQHLAARQAMINSSPRQVAQRQQLAHMSGQAMHGLTGQAAAADLEGQTSESEDRAQGDVASSHGSLRRPMAPGSTGEVLQLAGTKPNQPSKDGKYRIKLSSEREKFSYDNRVALGLDDILPRHHRLIAYWSTGDKVTDVRLADGTKVPLKEPIPKPTADKKLLCIDTVGYVAPKVGQGGQAVPKPEKLFIDVKIGHYTKSGQQWKQEGASLFWQVFKQLEHDAKDQMRTSRGNGYDIDGGNLKEFEAEHAKAKSGALPNLATAMFRIWNPLVAISRTMQAAPVTFVGASVFIVLNLAEPSDSAVKIIDPDHPILFNTGNLVVPGGVMAQNKLHGDRDWEDFKAKWEWNFRSGMANFLDWWDAKATDLLPKLQ